MGAKGNKTNGEMLALGELEYDASTCSDGVGNGMRGSMGALWVFTRLTWPTEIWVLFGCLRTDMVHKRADMVHNMGFRGG